jgi:hypothetical protein
MTESGEWVSPLSQKPSQGLIDDQGSGLEGESVMNLVLCDSGV